jgi:hypothetical protein
MIDALEKSLGIVTTACKVVGISRQTHYDWVANDSEYKDAVEAIAEMAIDFAESQLQKRMKDGSDTAIIFYLKTKGKKRGYIERQEIEHAGNGLNLNIIMPEGE